MHYTLSQQVVIGAKRVFVGGSHSDLSRTFLGEIIDLFVDVDVKGGYQIDDGPFVEVQCSPLWAVARVDESTFDVNDASSKFKRFAVGPVQSDGTLLGTRFPTLEMARAYFLRTVGGVS